MSYFITQAINVATHNAYNYSRVQHYYRGGMGGSDATYYCVCGLTACILCASDICSFSTDTVRKEEAHTQQRQCMTPHQTYACEGVYLWAQTEWW